MIEAIATKNNIPPILSAPSPNAGKHKTKDIIATPQFPEALFVQYMDTLDGRMNLMLDAIENDSNKDWTDNHNHFRSELYKK